MKWKWNGMRRVKLTRHKLRAVKFHLVLILAIRQMDE
jgi:hypothetical protein